MTYCRGCGHQIHETAPHCPRCGAPQVGAVGIAPHEGTLWLPVPALICGLLAALALLDAHQWDQDTALGVAMFAIAALVLAGVGLARQTRGRGMSIAGLVLGALGLLGAIGALV